MPNRILRENILTSERVTALSWAAEVFYRRLMSVVDDYGRFDGRISIIRTRLYPLQVDKVKDSDIQKWMQECAKNELVTLYVVDDRPYIELLRFGQKMRSASKYPSPADNCAQLRADDDKSAVFVFVSEGAVEGVSEVELSASPNDIRGNAQGEAESVPIPEPLDTEAFRKAWGDWISDRKDRRKKITERAARQQLKKLSEIGHDRAIAAIEHSIASGYTGIYEAGGNGHRGTVAQIGRIDAPEGKYAGLEKRAYAQQQRLANVGGTDSETF